jgi:hypothetical protein
VPARVPLDVDLEDRLFYGLTPTRLVYLVVALLAAFGIWSGRWGPTPLRGIAAALLVVIGVAAAWGRWRGRAADAWAIDLATFVIATHRVRWRRPRLGR